MDEQQRKRRQRKLDYNRKWIKASRALKRKPTLETAMSSSDSDNASQTTTSKYITTPDIPIIANENLSDENEECSTMCFTQDTPISLNDNTSNWDMIDEDNAIDYDSESETESTYTETLSEDLAAWINEFQIKHNAVDNLLKIFQKHGHSDIPSTARTLLKTKRNIVTEMKSGMEYLYYSLSDQLINVIDKYPQEVRDNITNLEISLNIDGLPLFKSSSKSVWPVLCAVHLDPLLIFPVALSYGPTKPANLDFLHDTITDLDNIMHNGLMYSGVNIKIKLRCVVCDAPAKCMVKGIKLYSGYFGCDRCDQRGNWFGRMTYQDTDNLSLRTNDSFRRQTNREHHNRDSPFRTLDIDMIAQFPIDYMHQCCLGVMKRLILIWIRGKKEVKMSALHSEQISNRLLGLQRFIPREFVRKPRGLSEIDRWKATEYRQFLLYTGKIVLKGILREDLYLHFMTFSVAICILASKSLLQQHHQYANALLKYFVEMGRNLYGPEFIVYNVHSMLHITSDAVKFGGLDEFSAFPFENYMQRIKRMVRSGKNPIVQIAKRLDEIENVKQAAKSAKETIIETKRPNNFYVISDSSCCEVMVMEYAVVEFVDPEDITMITVDIVHKTWLKSTQDAMFTYWPKLGASKKAKVGTIPDPQTWTLYKISILSTTEDYETATRRCKLAEDTSHIETEEEEEEEKEKTTPKRKTSQPSRYDDYDYEEEQGCSASSRKAKSSKSSSGMHQVTSNTTDESSVPSSCSLPCPPISTSTPRGRKDPICYDGISLSPEPMECSASVLALDSRPHSRDELVIEEAPIPPIVRMSRQERKDNTIMEKLDSIQKDQQEILSLLRKLNVAGSGAAEIQAEEQSAVDFNQIESVLEMESFCSRLQDDQSFRRKMVKQLSALGGFSSGDTIRRMLKTIGTNGLWSKYSLKGKKGKIAVQSLPVCAVMIKSYMKNYPSARTTDIEELIGETLKHAPSKPGGTRYKEPIAKRAADQEIQLPGTQDNI